MKTIKIILITSHVLFAQVIHTLNFDRFTHYEKDDWITYGYASNISSIDIGVNNIYFGTRGGGVWIFNMFSNEWLTPFTTSNGLSSNIISRVVYQHQTGELFAQTPAGTDIYNDAFEYWQPAADIPVANIQEHNTEGDELPAHSRPPFEKWPTFFPEKNFSIMLDGTLYNPDNEKYTFGDRIVDRWYRMWIATNGAGIGIADLQTHDIRFVRQSIPAIRPKDVFVSGDDIWIGGEPYIMAERGITHWDYQNNVWSYYKSGLDFDIFSDRVSVIQKCDRKIFFGTEQGLLMYNPEKKNWKNLSNIFPLKNDAVNDLCALGGELYVATDNGIFKYNPRTLYAEQISKRYINQTRVNSITSMQSAIYIATDYGIFKYDPQEDTSTLLKSKAAIADNYIDALAADKNTLWFAGHQGIGFFDTVNDEWHSFPALRFALKSKINHIELTRGNTWFATNDGLLKYDTKRDYWYLYTTKDGLADNRVYRIATDGDYLWLATYSGVTFFCWNRQGRLE